MSLRQDPGSLGTIHLIRAFLQFCSSEVKPSESPHSPSFQARTCWAWSLKNLTCAHCAGVWAGLALHHRICSLSGKLVFLLVEPILEKSKHSPRKPCFSDTFKKKYDSLLKTVYRLKPWPGNNFIIVSLWGGSAWAKCPIYTSWQ